MSMPIRVVQTTEPSPLDQIDTVVADIQQAQLELVALYMSIADLARSQPAIATRVSLLSSLSRRLGDKLDASTSLLISRLERLR